MNSEAIVSQLEPWIVRHRRSAWKPLVEVGDGRRDASKFCGLPWIGNQAPWPDCGVCKNPLQLFVQLDLGALPGKLTRTYGPGLLQLFYCDQESCAGSGGWEPFADDLSRVRVVQPDSPSLEGVARSAAGLFPAKRIVGWSRFPDLPGTEEQSELGLTYTYDPKAQTTRLECADPILAFDDVDGDYLAEHIANPAPGDKLGGWPCWIQGVEYPNCPRCQQRMGLLFQLDSEDNVPFMFGDAGCGHITQCPEHKDVVGFGWACS